MSCRSMPISSEQFRQMQARVGASIGPVKASEAAEREADLQAEIEAECRRRGWMPFRQRMDRAATMPVGFPDFVIMANDGRVIWIEAKAGKRKPSLEQRAMHAVAARLGHTVHVIRTMQEFYAVAH